MNNKECIKHLEGWLKEHYALDDTDKEVLKAAINALERQDGDCISRKEAMEFFADDEYVVNELNNLAPVTPEPKEGRWSHDGSHWKNRWICSECNYKLLDEQTHYCPNCGAHMEPYRED